MCFDDLQNLAHFQKEDQLHSLNFPEVFNSKKCGYFNAQKLMF